MKILKLYSLFMLVSITVCALAGFVNAGTGLESGKASKQLLSAGAGDKKAKAPPVDRSDPEAVAKAFIMAIANKNFHKAAQFVFPGEREQFVKELKKGIPPLPRNPKIRVIVKKDGVRADVAVLNGKAVNPPFGLDMKLSDRKWWIVK